MKLNIPGIYVDSSQDKQAAPLKIGKRETVAAFVGITEKGPLHKGVEIKEFRDFLKIFGGFSGIGYLPYSVFSFFNSGGKKCYVVRTAHQEGPGALSVAEGIIPSVSDEQPIRFTAKTPGAWGNSISIRTWHTVSQRLEITRAKEFDLIDTECIGPETLVRLTWAKGKAVYIRTGEKDGLRIHKTKKNNTLISVEALKFNITLSDGIKTEDFLFLSDNKNDERYISKILKSSTFVSVKFPEGRWFPGEHFNINLTGGRNGVIEMTPGDFIGYFNGLDDNKGLGIFRAHPEIDLIAVPDLALFYELTSDVKEAEKKIHSVNRAMIDQAEELADRMAIIDPPNTDDINSIIKYADKYDSSFAALYYPPVEILDPKDPSGFTSIHTPPSGAVAGIFAYCDRTEGMHHAPANKFIAGGVGMKYDLNDVERSLLYEKGINLIKSVTGKGIKVWGVRTLSSDPTWRFINVRRTFSLIASIIRQGTGWAVFEPNTISLRKRIIRHVSAFCLDLWRKGYLSGKTPENAFYVRCDDELNPPENIDAGIITTQVGLAITKPAEFLVITLNAESENANVILEEV